ncbi:polyamine ABC transporter substrate-binding protein [Marinobacterium sp. LSUCC0821]|uniref:polyamine ABC transporter substrate-binding protein n=1 Tax=Marinobacterium sp. LSUCC0821 TaxID=2668067 RepID=UPI0014515FA8|nr:polyamine ABC transporter substrate-binding protein [Marinobacterium sp. LSUCC0821]QJD70963.1 polyamine ABC transporter substrate-binding protein [Marinobacterium sp. LSUCC0821]
MKIRVKGASLLASALAVAGTTLAQAEQTVNVYNWSDYIAEETIANFEKETGIKVVYDVYDSNEVLEAKLLAGKSGYDVAFPTARPFADRHVKANLYQAYDLGKLSGYNNLDANILHTLSDIDPKNDMLIPYMWGTTGIGINVDKVKEILGADAKLDTWSLVFDPETVAKLASCGVTLMDDPTEVFVAARAFAGAEPNDYSKEGTQKAADVVNAVRSNIRYFHSSQYINDLANGDICVAHGYSGDILQARDRAAEANNGVNVAYLVPGEGAVVWTDVAVLLADAPHPAEAHAFVDYLLRPDVIADITNYVAYANANAASESLVDEEIRQDAGIYPPASTREKLFSLKTPTDRETRNVTRAWTRVKTGQ